MENITDMVLRCFPQAIATRENTDLMTFTVAEHTAGKMDESMLGSSKTISDMDKACTRGRMAHGILDHSRLARCTGMGHTHVTAGRSMTVNFCMVNVMGTAFSRMQMGTGTREDFN